jgi:YHS domain-containing protein
VWPFGKKGADSPAVHKAVVKGKTWYWSSTHRCYQVDSTVKAAIKSFHKVVEPSA